MSSITSLNPDLQKAFLELITKQTGLAISKRDRDAFYEKILYRIKTFKSFSPINYYQLLESGTLESYQEWERLIVLLTNNESYFFRDREQLNTLKNRIFPELIKRKRSQKTLRICSAGCSTGQEPYTLAILLKELLPDFHQWNILILGIDIDREALEIAEKGIYEPWSFRGVEEEIKKRYFHHLKQQYYLNSDIKKLVKFQVVNLVKDPFPQLHSELREMDLILCRNVFIYFENSTIAKILEKIYNTLQPSGYFITGHTELSGIKTSHFEKIAFPESIIYQRPSEEKVKLENNPKSLINPDRIAIAPPQPTIVKHQKIAQKTLATISEKPLLNSHQKPKIDNNFTQLKESFSVPTVNELLLEIEGLLSQENYQLAIEKIQQFLQKESNCFQAHYLLAQIQANLGQYEKAIQACQKAREIDSFALAPHYLLAKIAEEIGDRQEAKRILKQIIYLEPNSVSAYLDLSHIYQQECDRTRANKMREAALSILQQLPPNTKIKERGNILATELIDILKKE